MSPRSTCTSEQRVPRPTYRDEEASMASRKSSAHPDPEHRDPITHAPGAHPVGVGAGAASAGAAGAALGDRKSTRLNSSHSQISYAVFCLKKKKKHTND